jgi:LysM repeat protein
MKASRFFILILVILFAFGLAACTRSASQAPDSAESGDLPLPGDETPEPMSLLEEMATQTAIAQESGAKGVETEAGGEETTAGGDTAEETAGEESATGEGEAATPAETDTEADEEAGGGQETVVEVKEYDVPANYTLKSGEFPYCLARRFNISPTELLSVNGLTLNSQVYVGTTLKIPKDAGPYNQGDRALRAHPVDYTVVAGDTVYSIACLFGDVDPRAIVDVNNLGSGQALSAGQVIKIP